MNEASALQRRWLVDFSLALFNRSGKFFIGKDIVDWNGDIIDRVYYWRLARRTVPQGLAARIIGAAESLEHQARWRWPDRLPFGPSSRRPVLHLDPLTVLHRRLHARDMVLCHDLGPLTHPDLFDARVGRHYALAYRMIAKARPALVFVSKSSQAAFTGMFGPPARSTVIYPPIRGGSASAGGEQHDGVKPPYLLTVGAIGRRKNQIAAVRAFARSGLADRGFSYVMCGAREPGHVEVLERAADTAGVVVLPYVTDAQLRWLYGNASGFVLPSLLEGFGMPVAEAMAHGAIPIVSAQSVLEEVAGPGAIPVDPRSVDDIAAAMRMLAALDDGARRQRVAMLHDHVAQFSQDRFRRQWRDALAGD